MRRFDKEDSTSSSDSDHDAVGSIGRHQSLHHMQSQHNLKRHNRLRDVLAAHRDMAASLTYNAAEVPDEEPACWLLTKQRSAIALQHSSLFILSGDNPARIALYNITKHWTFETLIVLLILSNCVFLALDDPKSQEPYQETVEMFYAVAFTVEMLLKWASLGIMFHPGAYLRDRWNMLDFTIVVVSWLGLFFEGPNFTFFRTLRVLRPLRSMNAIRGLKVLVQGLLHSISGLLNVLLLTGLLFIIFGILGVQLWKGLFRQQCVQLTNFTLYIPAGPFPTPPKVLNITKELVIENSRCATSIPDGAEKWLGVPCPEGSYCGLGENPNYGFQNFDNILWAFLTVFQVITFEGWPFILRTTYHVSGVPSFIFFFLLILIGAFFVPNLALAVIHDKYQEAQRKQDELEIRQEEEALEEERRRNRQNIRLRIDHVERDPDDVEVVSVMDSIGPRSGVNPLKPPATHVSSLSMMSDHEVQTVLSEGSSRVVRRFQQGSPLEAATGIPTHVAASGTEETASDDTGPGCLWRMRNWVHEVTQGYSLAPDGTSPPEPPDMTQPVFVWFIVACILLNTIVLASQHYNQPDWLTEVAYYSNIVFTITFALEMLTVLFAVFPRSYFTEPFYVLDFVIVVSSLVEYLLAGSGVITVFRALRLLRVLKLLRNFSSLRSLVAVILMAVSDTLYLNVILGLFLFIFALGGRQFFYEAHEIAESRGATPIRTTFESFQHSFYAVFQVITTDDWVSVMWTTMKGSNEAAFLFFVTLLLLGTFVILNLFLSILISGFDKQGEADEEDDEDSSKITPNARLFLAHDALVARIRDKHKLSKDSAPGDVSSVICLTDSQLSIAIDDALTKEIEKGGVADEIMPFGQICESCQMPMEDPLPAAPLEKPLNIVALHEDHCFLLSLYRSKTELLDRRLIPYVRHLISEEVPFESESAEAVRNQATAAGLLLNVGEISSWTQLEAELLEEKTVVELKVGLEQVGGSLLAYTHANKEIDHKTNGGNALFLFGEANPFRVFISSVVHHPAFDHVVLVFIFGSSLLLAVDSPRDTDPDQKLAIYYLDIFFTAIFVIELCMKNISLGFIFHDGAYLRDGWNWLDCIIVIVSVISLFFPDSEFNLVKVLRALRALRPLRMVNRNPGLKTVVLTLIQSIKGITHVALLSLLNYLIFGILAVQFFGGKLQRCNDERITDRANCIGSFVNDDNEITPRRWRSQPENFDHIGNSILVLFQVSSGDTWVQIMYDAIDAVSDNVAPQKNYQVWVGWFFLVFFVIGNFFMLNLFVGVVIFNFNHVKDRMNGLLLAPDQRKWVETQRFMINFRPEMLLSPMDSRFSKAMGSIARSMEFEIGIALTILLNILVMAMEFYNQPDAYTFALDIFDYVFIFIFVMEAFIKISAFGGRYFFLSWNRFDFFLVTLSVIEVAIQSIQGFGLPIDVAILRVFRVFRLMRILRLFKQARKVRVLIETLWFSLPSLGNISGFLALILFIFAVLGMQLFANVKTGRVIDEDFMHFHNFLSSIQMMFIFTTNENWADTMHDCMVQEPDCSEREGNCGTWISPIFFVSFIIISAFVVSNLFIAIILDNFNTTMRLDAGVDFSFNDLHRYIELWPHHDPDATMIMKTREFPTLLANMKEPLGVNRTSDRGKLLRHCRKNIFVPEHGGEIHFVEVLMALAQYALGQQNNDRAVRESELQMRELFPEIQDLPYVRYRERTVHVGHFFGQMSIASAYRRTLAVRFVQKVRERRAAELDAWKRQHGYTTFGHQELQMTEL